MIFRTYLVTVMPKFISWNCNPYTTAVSATSRSNAIKIVRSEYNDNCGFTNGAATYTACLEKV